MKPGLSIYDMSNNPTHLENGLLGITSTEEALDIVESKIPRTRIPVVTQYFTEAVVDNLAKQTADSTVSPNIERDRRSPGPSTKAPQTPGMVEMQARQSAAMQASTKLASEQNRKKK